MKQFFRKYFEDISYILTKARRKGREFCGVDSIKRTQEYNCHFLLFEYLTLAEISVYYC